MKKFSIEYNHTSIPKKSKCLFMDISLPELSPLRRAGIKCLSFVHWFGPWMIERNGQSQVPHLDFYWLFGPGFSIESSEGILHAKPGDFLAVPSWIDRRQTITSLNCPHIYIRTDEVENFTQFQHITLRKSVLTEDFKNDFIRLAELCNPLHHDKVFRAPLAELVTMQFRKEVGSNEDKRSVFREKLFYILNQNPSGLSVPELAEKLCVSESSLYKKCMEFLNRSPGQLLTEHRLQNARQYLLSGSYPLREIAKLAGYSDEFAFSKAFTACFGISPSQYRKKR